MRINLNIAGQHFTLADRKEVIKIKFEALHLLTGKDM